MSFPEFVEWPKIKRLSNARPMVITEKIDGTNGQVYVPEDPSQPVLAASRNCWLNPPHNDNYNFGAWVAANQQALRALGPGRHYGEWWGIGVQRGYNIFERRFSLFTPWKYTKLSEHPDYDPNVTRVVPTLYSGPNLSTAEIKAFVEEFYQKGSVAAPGFMKPEGVVIEAYDTRWKVTDTTQGKK